MSRSNIEALAAGLIPVLFMLLLGFVAIIKTSRSALISDWKLLLLIVLTFSVTFGIGYAVARKVFHRSTGAAAIAGLLVGSPGVPFFGTTILGPLFGASSTVTVALMSIVINVLQVPAATVLLESGAASAPGGDPPSSSSGTTGTVQTAFYGTELDLQLRRRKITGIVLAGIATSSGVESTARAGAERGYEIAVTTDAVTDTNALAHTASVEVMLPRLGQLDTAGSIIAALAS